MTCSDFKERNYELYISVEKIDEPEFQMTERLWWFFAIVEDLVEIADVVAVAPEVALTASAI